MLRLKELRSQSNMQQKDVCASLNIPQNTYSQYENGKREPDSETLSRIADFFGVSVDYILGRTDDPNYIDTDDELNEYLEYLRTRPELKMLFSLTKDATKEDVQKAVKIIETMLGVD